MRGGGSPEWAEQPQLLSTVNAPAFGVNKSASNGAPSFSGTSSSQPKVEAVKSSSSPFEALSTCFQHALDRSTPHTTVRWLIFFALLATYVIRISFILSHHIVTYAYAIFLLSLLIGFLTPKIDPAWMAELENEEEMDSANLPKTVQDEFRPFMRRLPEFRCWLSASRASLIALACTLTEIFDVPVFWPILVVYFITLFGLTMKRQIAHMIRYRYVPFSIGKRRYGGRPPAHAAAASNGRVIHS